MTIRVRRLEETDDRSGFRSGNIDLDRFFIRFAGQNQFRHHLGTSYVAVDESGIICGYATVTASELTPEEDGTKRRGPRYPRPVLRLARLAVDERAAGRGIGTILLRSVLALALDMSAQVGCVGVVVDAKAEEIGFYERHGFMVLDADRGTLGDKPSPTPMFLSLGQMAE